MSESRAPVSRQAIVFAVALAGWAAFGVPAIWSLVAAYAIAWLAINTIAVAAPKVLDLELARPARWLLAFFFVWPLVLLARDSGALLDAEGLLGIEETLGDRLRLEHTPSIAPPVLFTDRPQEFYVYAPGEHELSVRFGDERAEVISLGAGLFRATYDPQGASIEGGTIEVSLGSVVRELEVVRPLAHPRWLRASPDRTLAATVSEETDELVVVGPEGLVRRVAVADAPVDCGFVSHDRVAVVHRFDPRLWIVRTSGEIVDHVEVGRGATRLAVGPSARVLAIAMEAPPSIVLVSIDSKETRRIALDRVPDWIAFGAEDESLVVSSRAPASLLRLATSSGHIDAQLLLGRPPVTMARSSDGATIVVATTDYRPDGTPNPGNHFIQDQLLTIDSRTLRVIAQRPTARRSDRQGNAGDVDRGGSPMGVDTGDVLRVAFAGTDEVWRIDPSSPEPHVTSLDDLPLAAPHGVVTFAGGRWAVSSPSSGAIGIFARDELVTLVQLAPDDAALLESDPRALARRLGEHDFYESTRSGIACQSCHMHAASDGAVHDIGDGRLAPTQTVAGVARTAPYLRDGSYPRLRDLHDLSIGLYRGFRRHAPGRAETLEAFLESLPQAPSARSFVPRDVSRERAGFAAFRKARCDRCHTPPAFTNLGDHPVGSLFPERANDLGADTMLDTPSLVGSGRRSAFLCDGRAGTLDAVLRDQNRSNRHGDTAALDDRELADLVEFLEAL